MYFWFLINQGDHAIFHATLAEALREYNAAKSVAERLMVLEPNGSDGQYDLFRRNTRIGELLVRQGNLENAYQAFLQVKKSSANSPPAIPATASGSRNYMEFTTGWLI